jgi:Fe-S cluster assembly protein SufD
MSLAATPTIDPAARWVERAEARLRAPAPGEPAAQRDRRREALSRFAALGLPTTRLESWRFTNPAPVVRPAFAEAATVEEAAAGRAVPDAPGPRLVFLNGRFAAGLSRLPDPAARVRAGSLARALVEGAPGTESLLARSEGPENAFALLNAALFEDGAYLFVPRETCLPVPLHLVFLAVPGAVPSACHPRSLVVLEPGTRVSVVETHLDLTGGTPGAPLLVNGVVEVHLGPNAHLHRAVVEQRGPEALHLLATEVRQERESRFESLEATLGARFSRSELTVRLLGEGGECELHGLYLADGDRTTDHRTRVEHVAPRCTSRELYKGIMDARGHGIFAGLVSVRPDAQRTDARLANHNLLLSADATADTKPELEIFADDVKCSHGATVGQVDEEALFYLRSRGLAPEAARALLLRAFVAEVTAKAATPDLRERLETAFAARLPGESLS